MKNISKKIIALIVIIMLVLAGLTLNVKAATITSALTTDSRLVAGSTVTININVDKPVYGISATLYYDTDVFESATVASTAATSADLSNNVIVIESGSAMPAGTIGTITLKVKDSISKTEAEVKLSNVKATDEAVTTQSLNSPSITIKSDAAAESGSEAGTPADTTKPTTNNTTKNTTKNITSSKTTSSKLPKAGDAATIVITAAVALIAIVGIVGFVKYAKNKDIK